MSIARQTWFYVSQTFGGQWKTCQSLVPSNLHLPRITFRGGIVYLSPTISGFFVQKQASYRKIIT
jgi:hypothetical protein